MKHQALFSSKDTCKSKKLKCRPLQFLFGALRVKHVPFAGKPKSVEIRCTDFGFCFHRKKILIRS